MPLSVFAGSLQVNSTTTTAVVGLSVTPLWLTIAEVLLTIGAIGVLGTLLTRIVREVVRRAGAPKSMVTSITQWLGVLTLLAAAGAVTTVAGLSSYLTALTVSGIAGLAISLALQNTITNVISGVLMQHDGIIRLGDDIQFGQGGVRGEVVKLSLRSTWLKTSDGVIIVIGNSNLGSGPILNYTSLVRLKKKLLT
ncbi:MAG: mechanosensitive ion channel [Thaumarchaeota archaeon]|nr:mechanosensitive ion channel [Nitrososphaerota archaeon]